MQQPTEATPRPRAPRPLVQRSPEERRQIVDALRLWVGITLVGIIGLASLVVWHVVRRGRILREGLGPPRVVDWPVDRPDPDGPPTPPKSPS